ncbi:MAG: hypothetical protein JSS60_08835 [Verrucomicrobia bacterium]|nr:hypothetical protein [Verrucomicrobiota bacterium]
MRAFIGAVLTFQLFSSSIIATTSSEVFAKYKNNCFVETGSFNGDGIQKALDAGFEYVYSIELSEKYHNICKKRFQHNPNVSLLFGDSAHVLGPLMHEIHEPVTFWLDGHCMLLDTAKGETMTPLLKELEAIKNHPIKTHTILIDDIRLLGTWILDNIPLNAVIAKLKEINPEYTIAYEDGYEKKDVLVAYIPSQGMMNGPQK